MTYIPHVPSDVREMLAVIGVASVDELFDAIPEEARLKSDLKLAPALSEPELRLHLGELASRNRADVVSFVGAGCCDHFIPAVVDAIASRGEFVTAYTPYQPEASQGSLQVFFEYQTLIAQLTGCEVSNSSLYDGASATAEAALMATSITGRVPVAVSEGLHPDYLAVLGTYLSRLDGQSLTVEGLGGKVEPESLDKALAMMPACLIVQSPDFFGNLLDLKPLAEKVHAAGALLVAVVDPISLALVKRPGEVGADIVVGEGQPLGNTRSFGGPGFGFLASRMEFVRRMPGRLVGETVDRRGKRGFVLTLQTREQHIRREKATSNICTNHALCALRAAVYLSVMGKQGLRRVAELCLAKAHYAADSLAKVPGVTMRFPGAPFFKEFAVELKDRRAADLRATLWKKGVDPGLDLGRFEAKLDRTLLVAVTENRTRAQIDRLVAAVAEEMKR